MCALRHWVVSLSFTNPSYTPNELEPSFGDSLGTIANVSRHGLKPKGYHTGCLVHHCTLCQDADPSPSMLGPMKASSWPSAVSPCLSPSTALPMCSSSLFDMIVIDKGKCDPTQERTVWFRLGVIGSATQQWMGWNHCLITSILALFFFHCID